MLGSLHTLHPRMMTMRLCSTVPWIPCYCRAAAQDHHLQKTTQGSWQPRCLQALTACPKSRLAGHWQVVPLRSGQPD